MAALEEVKNAHVGRVEPAAIFEMKSVHPLCWRVILAVGKMK